VIKKRKVKVKIGKMKNTLAIIIFSLLSVCGYCQDFTLNSYVDQNNITTDEYIRFIIESNERIQLNKLQFKDFIIKQGPYTSQSSQTTIINGKFESSQEFKSTFILVPKKEGVLTIESITVNYKGKNYSTKNIKINVSKGKKDISNNSTKNKTSNQSNKLFAKITASKTKPYIGENILIQYKIYQSVYHVRNLEITDYELPMSNDFWTELIDPPNKQWKESREVINGIQYSVYVLKKEIVSAQKAGKLKIPSFSVSTLVNRDFFNRGIEKELISNSVVLNVKELPANAPTNFSGQVGKNYKLDVSITKNDLKVDEALDVGIEISGNGNLKQLKLPEISYPQDLEKYPEELKSSIKINEKGIYGKKKISQLLIPRFHGEFEIPEISFTYFDIQSKKYKKLSHPSTIIKVQKSKNLNQNSNSISSYQKPDQNEVEVINQNIHHIKTITKLNDFSEPFFGTLEFWSLVGSFPLGLVFFLLIFNNKEKFTNSDKVLMKKVVREINHNFKIAKNHLEKGEKDEFYSEIYKLWTNYLSHKFKIEIAALNKDKINSKLNSAGINEDDIKILSEILNYCEMSQYSPVSTKLAQSSFDQSKLLFKKLEQNV